MTGYNIAANQRRVSPVREMLQTQAQMDAHKVNQLNIERAEIEMPYVKQLTEQRVAQNELAIESQRTRNQYLETQLQQQERATEANIQAQENQNKIVERQMRFDERLSEVMEAGEDPRILRSAFPNEYRQYVLGEADAAAAGLETLRGQLTLMEGMPESAKPEYWRGAIERYGVDMPPEMAEYTPEAYAALKRGLEEQNNLVISGLLNEIEWYKDPNGGNDPQMVSALMRKLESLGQSTVGGTQKERLIEQKWGWTRDYGADPSTVDAVYSELNKQVQSYSREYRDQILFPNANERLLFQYATPDEIKAQVGEEAYYDALAQGYVQALDQIEQESPGQRDFYLWAREGLTQQAYPDFMQEGGTREPPRNVPGAQPPPEPEPEPAVRSQKSTGNAIADIKIGETYVDPDTGIEYERVGEDAGNPNSWRPVDEQGASDDPRQDIIERERVRRSREQGIEDWLRRQAAKERARTERRLTQQEAEDWWNSLSEEEKEQQLRGE